MPRKYNVSPFSSDGLLEKHYPGSKQLKEPMKKANQDFAAAWDACSVFWLAENSKRLGVARTLNG